MKVERNFQCQKLCLRQLCEKEKKCDECSCVAVTAAAEKSQGLLRFSLFLNLIFL
jgi:hypothetical protein